VGACTVEPSLDMGAGAAQIPFEVASEVTLGEGGEFLEEENPTPCPDMGARDRSKERLILCALYRDSALLAFSSNAFSRTKKKTYAQIPPIMV